jgi:hypothetical protein
VVRIKNTLNIGEIEISASLLEEFEKHPDLERAGDLAEMRFDETGRLL